MADTEVKVDLPATIKLVRTLTPNEMRAVKAASGLPLGQLFTDDNIDLGTQAMVYVALRRAGYEASWDDAGDVAPDTDEAVPDPTSGVTSTALSAFANGGA